MNLLDLAPYLGAALGVIIVVGMFLKFLTDIIKSRQDEKVSDKDENREYEKQQEREKELAVLKSKVEMMQNQILNLENKGSVNLDSLYKEINEIKKLFMDLKLDLSEKYVKKSDCEKNH